MPKAAPSGPELVAMKSMESAEHAVEQIRRAIVDGRFKSGDRLVENRLTAQLGLSRHPVREALRRLDREGLVELRLNRGAVVASLEPTSIIEVYQLRAALGDLALRQIIGGPIDLPGAVVKDLERKAKNAIIFAKRPDQEASISNDLEFQASIVAASGLERTVRIFDELTGEVQRFNNMTRVVYSEREADAETYVVGLLNAIRDKDLDRAQATWRRKFAVAVQRFLDLMPHAAN